MVLAKLFLSLLAFAAGDLNDGFSLPTPMLSVYEGASGSLTATPAKVVFTTATVDTMPGTLSAGVFDCGAGGYYSVSASLAINATISLNNTLTLSIMVSGVNKRTVSVALPALLTKASTSVSNVVYCGANGTIQVNASSNALAPTITNVASENTFTILKLFIDK